MKPKILWFLTASMVLVCIIFLWRMKMRPLSPMDAARNEFTARSRQYIRQWGEKSPASLTREQKLLLLHAYYNMDDNAEVIRMAESMVNDLQALALGRQAPFLEMIREAYEKSDQKEKGNAFLRQFPQAQESLKNQI